MNFFKSIFSGAGKIFQPVEVIDAEEITEVDGGDNKTLLAAGIIALFAIVAAAYFFTQKSGANES